MTSSYSICIYCSTMFISHCLTCYMNNPMTLYICLFLVNTYKCINLFIHEKQLPPPPMRAHAHTQVYVCLWMGEGGGSCNIGFDTRVYTYLLKYMMCYPYLQSELVNCNMHILKLMWIENHEHWNFLSYAYHDLKVNG